MKAMIFDIKRFAIHDGPGIRTTVFFKGCPLNCRWCHNPEGISPAPELLVNHRRCVKCGTCENACPEGAIRLSAGRISIDRANCTLCGDCLSPCPARAITKAGREAELDELARELLSDEVFFSVSGGGVTLSGGEPLYQGDFALALLERLKKEGISTCVETSMMAGAEIVKRACNLADHFLVDIKLMDEKKHLCYTGVSNRTILENYRYLALHARDLRVRVPLIPGITDGEDNLLGIAAFARELRPDAELELLNYNALAPVKYDSLDRQYFGPELRPLAPERFEYLKALTGSL